jgi:hypothetical protein
MSFQNHFLVMEIMSVLLKKPTWSAIVIRSSARIICVCVRSWHFSNKVSSEIIYVQIFVKILWMLQAHTPISIDVSWIRFHRSLCSTLNRLNVFIHFPDTQIDNGGRVLDAWPWGLPYLRAHDYILWGCLLKRFMLESTDDNDLNNLSW